MPPGTLASVLADASLPALALAADAGYLNPLFARALDAPEANLLDVTVLNHKPGRRCTLLYEVGTPNGRSQLVGKWQRDTRVAARLHERQTALNLATEAPPLPKAFLVTAEGLALQEYVGGVELRDIAGQGEMAPFAAAGAWLARLHALTPVVGLSLKTRAHELAKIESWLAAVSSEPALADDAASLKERMSRMAPALVESAPVMIHRDYYAANLIWDGATLWGIDIDQMALGDPGVDVGSFVAQLEKLALRATGRIDAYEQERAAFLDAYGRIDGRSLAFFSAYTFAKLAAAEVQRRRPDWREVAAAFLQRAINLTAV